MDTKAEDIIIMEERTMKRMTKLLTLALALCLLLSVSALASAEPSAEPAGGVAPGTYTDGTNTLVINDDLTFIMYKDGENMDGAAIAMTVVGTVSPDAVFTITGIFDGELDVLFLATEDQIAGDQAAVEACYAAGAAGAAPAGVVPGTYTDGTHTLVIADDMTFTMKKAGENMDGASFEMTVNGTVTADGVFTITALLDGDIDVFSLASEDQKAADLATVEEVYAAATAAAPAASGEPSGEAGGDTSKAAYAAYLKEFVDAVPAVADEHLPDFYALIDAEDYTTMPADMMFNPTWWGYAAMTYDEFVAAGGVYEIPAFDPGLTAD